uniref:Uncharacterized protein n=1 Tax=Setaria digitata TaxID=48799 RepID=A0A915PLR2_9BILA
MDVINSNTGSTDFVEEISVNASVQAYERGLVHATDECRNGQAFSGTLLTQAPKCKYSVIFIFRVDVTV